MILATLTEIQYNSLYTLVKTENNIIAGTG